MKRFLLFTLSFLLILTLISCGKKEDENEPLPQVDRDKIEDVLCSNESCTMRFHNNGEHWVWMDDLSFPLDETNLSQLFDDASTLSSLTAIGNTDDLEAFGLNEPTRFMTLTESSSSSSKPNKTTTLYFGNKASDDSVYMQVEGRNGIYLAPIALSDFLDTSIYDMAIIPVIEGIRMDTIKTVTIHYLPNIPETDTEEDTEPVEQEPMIVILSYRDGKWYRGSENVSDSVPDLAAQLATLDILRCVDYAPAEGASAVCGLDPAQFTLEISYLNDLGETQSIEIIIGGLRDDETGHYATLGDSSTIYLVTSHSLESVINYVNSLKETN